MSSTAARKLATVVLIVGSFCAPALALQIIPTFVDGVGYTWDSTMRGVFNQAIADWETWVLDDQTVDVTVKIVRRGQDFLARWRGSGSFYAGTNVYPWTDGIEHVIEFNANLFTGSRYLWWDETPLTSSDVPAEHWDALTVSRHELGHTMGFVYDFYVDDFYQPGEIDRWGSHIVGTTFDPGGLDVQMASSQDLGHVADAGATTNDLMTPTIINGTRHKITWIDLQMLELAHGYTLLQRLAGDANDDGEVDLIDLGSLATFYGTGFGARWEQGDFNFDGAVDLVDLGQLASNYGAGAGSAVPEPATLLLLSVFAPLALAKKPRGRLPAGRGSWRKLLHLTSAICKDPNNVGPSVL